MRLLIVSHPPLNAELGAAQLPHSAGVPIAIAKNPSQFRQGRDDRNELDKYADMDDAKAADLVKTLVAHHVALVPTFMINYRGYPKNWDQYTAEAHEWFKDPNLLKYYPKEAMESAQYEDELEKLLVELARSEAALRQKEAGR